jgi:hypothetical protein
MQNKDTKFTDFENPMEMFEAFAQIVGTPGFENFFGGMIFEEKEKYPHDRLGDGYELRKIELKDSKGNPIYNRDNYSHLYHNDLKVSNEVFRRGGTGGEFKDGYCKLIHYVKNKKNSNGFDFGTHVIINHLGEICMGKKEFDNPNHIGGHLCSIGNYIYDLRNGKAIAPKSSTSIIGTNCIIVEHKYDWYNDVELPLGIYRIDFQTAEITKIDEVK